MKMLQIDPEGSVTEVQSGVVDRGRVVRNETGRLGR